MKMKTYEAKIYLKSGGPSVAVTVQAQTTFDARRLIEAQYAGQFKGWAASPREVRR